MKFIKLIYYYFVHILNSVYLLNCKNVLFSKCKFFYFRLNINDDNTIILKKSKGRNSNITITGMRNEFIAESSEIEECIISISGNGNKIILEEGVKLRKATIHIRGTNCLIRIGKNTSFGQVRMVNVGKNNEIIIGKNCLFADNIELWASDTHSIYDKNGIFINPEKPIIIGDNVWIGAFVKILKGVIIGNNVIVGMNSFVTKSINENVLCAGNPIRILKEDVTWKITYQNE